MSIAGIIIGMGLVLGGIVAVLAAAWRAHAQTGALAYLTDGDGHPVKATAATENIPPIVERILHPLARRLTNGVRSLYPTDYLDRLHRQLLHAGLATKIRAEELATVQVIIMGIAGLAGVTLCVLGGGSLRLRIAGLVLLVVVAALGPPSWLARRVRERTTAIERDLPDVLDLLTIAVESGLGLEQAMEAACADFDSPMSEEMARTLQEMSLGLSRQQALENLKERSASVDLISFVLVLTQADALGMPIGRVLRTQADEMRERRRARARERAAKLPVKILFPLMVFILPPLMIIVLGPAATAIYKAFHL